MSDNIFDSYVINVTLITEEGVEGDWIFPSEVFAASGNNPIPVDGPVRFSGKVYRAGDSIFLDGSVTGGIRLACSRCLADMTLHVEGDVTAVYMPKDAFTETGDDVELSAEDMDLQFFEGDELSLFEPVRDCVALLIPIQPLCKEECKGLCSICGKDLNKSECACEPPSGDHRFAILSKLK